MVFILKIYIAYILDLMFGDPYVIPHPVQAIGKLISFLEKRLIPNSISRSRIAMEMVGWVTYNSSAAFVMLWQRLAVQK